MKNLLSLTLSFFLLTHYAFAQKIGIGALPDNSLITTTGWGLIDILTFMESFLLKVVLPIIIIGSALYIAYELFLAEGNEEKMKKAWKSLTFSSIGVISIGLAYAVIAIVSRLSI